MRFSLVLSYRDAWPDLVDIARRAEQAGIDGLWFPDHFMYSDDSLLDQPVYECWTVLAALAASVPRVRIGAMVTGNTYRHPAVLAKMAATVAAIADGRLVLGLGAGWQQNEHDRYGIELGSPRERLQRLDEACHIVRGLLTQDRTTFDGAHYQVHDAPCEPKPPAPIPLMIGGSGEKVTLRIVARHADEWNGGGSPERFRHLCDLIDGYCAEIGRDPSEIARTASIGVFLSEDEVWLDSLRARGLDAGGQAVIGNPGQVAEAVAGYRDAGVDELLLQSDTLGGKPARKVSTLELFMTKVAPAFI